MAKVQAYVPGYRLKQRVQFERFGANNPVDGYPATATSRASRPPSSSRWRAPPHYLPAYAGNLDIMTAAGLHDGRADRQQRTLSKREPCHDRVRS